MGRCAQSQCRRSFAGALLSLLAVACTLDLVKTMPLAGSVPDVVLVMPPRNATDAARLDLQPLIVGADRALRGRGYRVLPLDISRDLLRDSNVDSEASDPASLARLKMHANVDAVLVITVKQWRAVAEAELLSADWQLSWTLRSTNNGNVMWQFDDAGSFSRPAPPLGDPAQSREFDPEVKPFGTTLPQTFRTAAELIQALHRKAMQRLPQGSA